MYTGNLAFVNVAYTNLSATKFYIVAGNSYTWLVEKGDWVEVELASGEAGLRRVVSTLNDTVYVCRAETYAAAQSAGREPVCAGFKTKWVRKVK